MASLEHRPGLERFPLTVPDVSTGRSPWTGTMSVLLHALALAGFLVLPLVLHQPLPTPADEVHAFFTEPISLAPPPPPPPAEAARAHASAARPAAETKAWQAPSVVPTELPPQDGLDLGLDGGVPGGVEGGVPGGVVGGVVGGLPDAPAPAPGPQRVRVGKDIRAPRKVRDVPPVYPNAARLSRLEGTVVVECVIDAHGRVQNAAVLRGVPLLDAAALEAVRQWVYAPSLLDGVPVEVVMTVTLTFQLR